MKELVSPTVSLGVVAILALLPMIGLAVVVFVWRWLIRLRQERNPVAEKLMRPAGESLRRKIEKLEGKFENTVFIAIAVPLAVLAVFFACAVAVGKKSPEFFWPILAAGCGTAVLGWLAIAWQSVKILSQRRNCHLGLHGERAAAEELNQLMLDGMHVFHDVPLEPYGNIDHVVVAPSAVYAIETKTRRKRKAQQGKKSHEVQYAEGVLEFPGFRDTRAIEQAEQQANRLRSFLTKSIAETVRVVPVVTLPGWYVVSRTKPKIWVLPPKALRQWIANERADLISPQSRTRIAARLEEMCRDVQL